MTQASKEQDTKQDTNKQNKIQINKSTLKSVHFHDDFRIMML